MFTSMSLGLICSYLMCWNNFGLIEPGTGCEHGLQTDREVLVVRLESEGGSINNSDILWYFYLVCISIFRSDLLPVCCSFWKARSGWPGPSDQTGCLTGLDLHTCGGSCCLSSNNGPTVGHQTVGGFQPLLPALLRGQTCSSAGEVSVEGSVGLLLGFSRVRSRQRSSEDCNRAQYNSLLQNHLRNYSAES